MSSRYDESALITAATAVHGNEEVLAAGVFSLQALSDAQIAGAAAGAAAGSLTGSSWGGAAGAVAGEHVAVDAAAAANGVTVGLLVAVTAERIYVHDLVGRRADGPVAGDLVASFVRSSTLVTVHKMGLSRIVRFEDAEAGSSMSLHGSVSPLSSTSNGDRVVLALLGTDG